MKEKEMCAKCGKEHLLKSGLCKNCYKSVYSEEKPKTMTDMTLFEYLDSVIVNIDMLSPRELIGEISSYLEDRLSTTSTLKSK